MTDTFQRFWHDQEQFMKLLIEKRSFPQFPMDLEEKDSQGFIKHILHDLMLEVSEAIRELKNSKRHRASNVSEFDRAAYVEELVDIQKFLLEVVLLSGVSFEEFVDAYFVKSAINTDRINGEY